MCATYDGEHAWSPELDMQLAELFCNCAAQNSVAPMNLCYASLENVISIAVTNEESCFFGVNKDRAMMRASLLREPAH